MMSFKFRRGFGMVHLLNRLSIYYCHYLEHETTEYWSGYDRVRIFKFKRLTMWVRK